MKLLKSQETELFDLIINQGFNPLQFDLKFQESELDEKLNISLLKFINSDYYFKFSSNLGKHYSTFCPGNEKYIDTDFPGSWKYQKENVSKWLYYLDREIKTPDKWQRLLEESENLKLMKYEEDSNKFTASEYLEIKSKIELLKDGLKEIGLIEIEIKTINSKLDHLVELIPAMDKIDWKNILVGALINLPIQLSLAPEITKSLFNLVKKIFSMYFLA